MRKLKFNERGQGMTEYIILVALIAIAAMAAVKYFSKSTSQSFKSSADAVQSNVNSGIATGNGD